MKINKSQLLKSSKREIEQLLEKNGSLFISDADENSLSVQHVVLTDSSVTALEYSPEEQFEQIMPNVWYREYTMPKVKNSCYWLFKNCQDYPDEDIYEDERFALYYPDPYSKNIFNFRDENGDIYFKQNFFYSLPKLIDKYTLQSEKLSLFSKALRQDRDFILEYPLNFDKNKTYKILLITDGDCWKYSINLGQTLTKLAIEQGLDQYIICYINHKNRSEELFLNKKFAKFISVELTELISKKLGIPFNKDNFVFSGQSYGGLMALTIAMYFPERIGTIISQSASLGYDKKDTAVKYFASHKPKTKLYYSFGNNEIPFIKDKGILFKDFLKDSADCAFNIFSGGHNYISWQDDLIYALQNFVK